MNVVHVPYSPIYILIFTQTLTSASTHSHNPHLTS
jgi:hypothetical protein